jgi:hypothetical protein
LLSESAIVEVKASFDLDQGHSKFNRNGNSAVVRLDCCTM